MPECSGKKKAKTDACKTDHSMGDESYKALLDFFLYTPPEIVSQENSGLRELFFDIKFAFANYYWRDKYENSRI